MWQTSIIPLVLFDLFSPPSSLSLASSGHKVISILEREQNDPFLSVWFKYSQRNRALIAAGAGVTVSLLHYCRFPRRVNIYFGHADKFIRSAVSLFLEEVFSFIWRLKVEEWWRFERDVIPLSGSQGNTIPGVLKFHGVITTFEMIMADCPELKKLHWRCVVIDEAHRLKNRNCKLLEGLKLMNLVSQSVFLSISQC